MKTFDPKNKNLIEIFSDNSRYEVPRFQRGYDWGMEQIQNFWLDLQSVKEKDKDSVFFGNLIFLRKDSSGKVLSIIDGQQRITTLQLLLIAIRSRAKMLSDFTIQTAKINDLVVHVSNKFAEQENTNLRKLTPAKSIKPLFDKMSDFGWDGVIPSKISGVDGRNYRKIKGKLEPIYNFFFEKVKDMDKKELAELLSSLEKIFVTEIEIDDPEEAFDIFERTNARGVKLAQSDLVKNLLFQNAEESLHDEIDEKWEQISENSSDKLSQMLKYYVITFKGKTLKKDIFPTLSDKLQRTSSETLINGLLDFSMFYKLMTDEGTSSSEVSLLSSYFSKIDFKNIIEDIPRKRSIVRSITAFQLFKITQVYPLVYCYIKALHLVNEDLEERGKKSLSEYLLTFLQRLENFHFVNTVIGKNIGNQVEGLYSEYAKRFYDLENVETFLELEKEFKKALIDIRESKRTFISKFMEVNYDDEERGLIVYMFDRISNAESKGDQIYDLFNPDKNAKTKSSNIEHFYPRKMFETDGDPIGSDSGNNIGNLLVLSMHTNSAFNNASPKEKFSVIHSDSKYLMNLANSNLVIMKYENEDWGRELIDKRANDLAIYGFETVWNVNI